MDNKLLLVILDGVGIREDSNYNAVKQAKTPNLDRFMQSFAHGVISASSVAVGLPKGQFGNSEVGHLNIAAGRVVLQDITRIDNAISDGSFATNKVLLNNLNATTTGVVHLIGLLSDGGVHSHIKHIFAMIKLASQNENIKTIYLHMLLDGRDTPPQSALTYVNQLEDFIKTYSKVKIATLGGRYYGMDRDRRYDRLKLAYDAMMFARSDYKFTTALEAVNASYFKGINDEFVNPCILGSYPGMMDGDSVVMINFRSDRAIQLADALTNPHYQHFEIKPINFAAFTTMTSYDPKLNVTVAFSQNIIKNTLGECIANLGLKQLRIAETEKYPHVTYFFNGGNKTSFSGEDRILIDSPKDVTTYNLKPEMSLPEVTQALVNAIYEEKYTLIVTNFANGDMVGHTGDFSATIKAVEALDHALGQCVDAMINIGGEVLIIADHGNCEEMFDAIHNQPHTQHTTDLVPCIYIGRLAKIREGGALQDVAPTILDLLDIAKPIEMTGESLVELI